jgi:DNA-binding LacI/PurR family transcriptional regulator
MNIGEIARRAGVSRSTVSYVLSGKRPIGQATRDRVLAIIEQSEYRPSATARALSNGSTRTIALVVPRMHHHLDIEILRFVGGIAEAAAEDEFDTLISPSGGGEREDAIERLARERRVDGFILMETLVPDPRAEFLLNQGFPFVTIGRAGFDERHDWVDTDYPDLVTEAVDRLAALGHRRLALVNRPQEMFDKRYCLSVYAAGAFEDACRRHRIDGTMFCCEEDEEGAIDCLAEILSTAPAITGLVSVNDRSLAPMMDELVARRLIVPQDLSIIAVASSRIAQRTSPPVTAADVPAHELAGVAVQTLLNRIAAAAAPPVRQLFRTEYVDRGSTAGPSTTRPT